ncbi:MAG: sigma-E factor negative regulatory protein [Betaproteobacteria bacterium]|nr:sigma-E factor negative regulatory protein [Betaproteobacteria bacterium]
MNEKLSSLVDGELPAADAVSAIKSLGNNEAARRDWCTCHVIGEAMRGESPVRLCDTEAIFVRLAAEPTILAPAGARPQAVVGKNARMALAMAASVVTVSAISVIAFRQQGAPEAPAQLVSQVAPQPMSAAPGAATPVQVNDYLAIHRQFARSGGLQEASFNRAGKAAGR